MRLSVRCRALAAMTRNEGQNKSCHPLHLRRRFNNRRHSVVFRITPATGIPAPLERVKVKYKRVPFALQQGMYDPHIEGTTSPASFRYGEPLVLAVRMLSPGDKWGREATPIEIKRHVALIQLAVKDG